MSSPSDEDLQLALSELKAANPTLGIPKLHARLKSDYPEWTVSEKRMRKTLAAIAPVQDSTAASPHPASGLVEGLNIDQWTKSVDVRFFDKRKGKGLVAKQKITAGDTIWVEDPFILAPEWEIYDKQRAGQACSQCTTLFAHPSEIRARCQYCPAVFCNALCRKRSDRTHPVLCPTQNPACMPLLRWIRQHEWMALHALTQCAARLALAPTAQALADDWNVVRALASLGMEDRAKYSFRSEPDRKTWRQSFALFCDAFHRPRKEQPKKTSSDEERRIAAILRKALPVEIETAFFEYEAGFLHRLGSMSLNLEAHGGLYTLHAHMNHSCSPNVSVRHLDQRKALSRITVRASTDIEPGQELFITYVNPAGSYAERRSALEAWGFVCQCSRCLAEGKDWKPPAGLEGMDDLASELKAGLGVM